MDESKILEIMNKGYFGADPDEKEVLEHLPLILASVKVFVDIGASLGQYALHVNKHIRGGEIFAIEADPFRFAALKDNCREWVSLSDNKLHPIHAALSDSNGEAHFYTTNSPVSGGLFIHDVSHVSEERRKAIKWEEIIVKSLKLDTLVGDVGVDLIKIDVEGGGITGA